MELRLLQYSDLLIRLMQASVRQLRQIVMLIRQLWLVSLVIALAAGWFLLSSGGGIQESSRSVLHGLCAQRPTHSFRVGGELLPFDARMTGIYTGALLSWIVLLARRRLLTRATPSVPVVVLLVVAVAVLGVDGVNALLVDLGQWHPYTPHNAVRFFTGFGTGVALTSLLSWLIGTSLWKMGRNVPVWRSAGDLFWVAPASFVAFVVLKAAPGSLYPLFAILLMASAWITVTGLVLVMLVSGFRLEAGITSLPRLHLPLAESAVVALAIMLGLAQARFWLERTLGIPQDLVAVAPNAVGTILFGWSWPFG